MRVPLREVLAAEKSERSVLRRFSRETGCVVVYLRVSSTMGNNGLKLIQLFQRGKEDNLVPIHANERATFGVP